MAQRVEQGHGFAARNKSFHFWVSFPGPNPSFMPIEIFLPMVTSHTKHATTASANVILDVSEASLSLNASSTALRSPAVALSSYAMGTRN